MSHTTYHKPRLFSPTATSALPLMNGPVLLDLIPVSAGSPTLTAGFAGPVELVPVQRGSINSHLLHFLPLDLGAHDLTVDLIPAALLLLEETPGRAEVHVRTIRIRSPIHVVGILVVECDHVDVFGIAIHAACHLLPPTELLTQGCEYAHGLGSIDLGVELPLVLVVAVERILEHTIGTLVVDADALGIRECLAGVLRGGEGTVAPQCIRHITDAVLAEREGVQDGNTVDINAGVLGAHGAGSQILFAVVFLTEPRC